MTTRERNRQRRRSRPGTKKKKRKRDTEDMGTSDGGSNGDTNIKRRKKQKTDDDRGEDEDGHKLKRKSTSKRSGGGNKVSGPDSQSETGSSLSEGNSDEESKPTRLIPNSRKSSMSSQSKKRAHARSRSPLASLDDVFRGAYVYRAVHQERVALGWSEAPCGSCPVFDFCKEGGPVGPGGCEYYGEWLKRATITMDI